VKDIMKNTQQDALRSLLDVYRHRSDLQKAFPEVETGDHGRLVQWAAGVCANKWSDPAFPILHGYEQWYLPEHNLHLVKGHNPAAAFKTWDQTEESLEDVEMRIHDCVPREMLHARADAYLDSLSQHFPHAMPHPGALVLEIGSGVGYIMEAVDRRFQPRSLIGLDVAPAMVAKAQQRLVRDKATIPAQFVIYDGITIPIESESIDFIYSVACLQHVPKPYVYNLFGEMLRILKTGGFAALHLLSFAAVKLWNGFDFRREIAQQLLGAEEHWHHFYCAEELSYVLEYGYGAVHVKIVDTQDGSIWTSFAPSR
jgi:SAM-dependent methyltransferase